MHISDTNIKSKGGTEKYEKTDFKRLFCHVLAAGMALSLVFPAADVTAADTAARQTAAYTWENHDRQVEYPPEKTTAQSNTMQQGYGPEKMLDKNNESRWEAAWNNPPEQTELILRPASRETEYFTGIKYVSRLDNNISGSMSHYKLYKTEDGITWQEIPGMDRDIVQKLGTFYIVFDKPVKAKRIKLKSDVKAVSELRLLYVPSEPEDYAALKAEAIDLREKAGEKSGEDIGLWKGIFRLPWKACRLRPEMNRPHRERKGRLLMFWTTTMTPCGIPHGTEANGTYSGFRFPWEKRAW